MPALPAPWRVFGLMGKFILIAWIIFGATILAPDAAMIAKRQIGNEYSLIGRDFVNIWFGGRQAQTGETGRVYDRQAYRDDLQKTAGLKGIYAFSYPPTMLALSLPFGQMPYLLALACWTVLTFGLFWHAARPWLEDAGLPSWSVFILPASLVNLWAGHFGFLIAALALYGWRHAANGAPIRSGLGFAMMTVKPHLGILVPFILAAKRKWHVIFSTIAISVVFILISVMIFGIESWQTWISSTLPFQSSLIGLPNENMGYLRMMPTGERLATSLGLSGIAAAGVQISLAFGGIGLLAHAWRRGVDFADLGLLSIIAVFLILPYVFNYDMVGFNLALLVLSARVAPKLKLVDQIILGAAFLIPVVQMALAQNHLQIAPLLILASLAILSRRLPAQ